MEKCLIIFILIGIAFSASARPDFKENAISGITKESVNNTVDSKSLGTHLAYGTEKESKAFQLITPSQPVLSLAVQSAISTIITTLVVGGWVLFLYGATVYIGGVIDKKKENPKTHKFPYKYQPYEHYPEVAYTEENYHEQIDEPVYETHQPHETYHHQPKEEYHHQPPEVSHQEPEEHSPAGHGHVNQVQIDEPHSNPGESHHHPQGESSYVSYSSKDLTRRKSFSDHDVNRNGQIDDVNFKSRPIESMDVFQCRRNFNCFLGKYRNITTSSENNDDPLLLSAYLDGTEQKDCDQLYPCKK